MKPGTVFKWENFPEAKFGDEKKPRWFVFLGESPSFLTPHWAYIHTTTTQLDHFQKGGSRYGHQFITFDCTKNPFEENCVLDADEGNYPIEKKD